MTLWQIEVSDHRHWAFVTVLEVESRTATIVLNGVLEHKTRLDDSGRFERVPGWLPQHVRAEMEEQIRRRADSMGPAWLRKTAAPGSPPARRQRARS